MAVGLKRARDEQEKTSVKSVDNDVNTAVLSLAEANAVEVDENARRRKSFRAALSRRSVEGVAKSPKENAAGVHLSPACAALTNALRHILPALLAQLTSNQANLDNFEKNAERGQNGLAENTTQEAATKLSPAERANVAARKNEEQRKAEEITVATESTIFIDLISKPAAAVAVMVR